MNTTEISKGEIGEIKTFEVGAVASRPGAFAVLVNQDSAVGVCE